MNIAQITLAAQEIVWVLDDYATDSTREREVRIDAVLYAYLQAKFARMSRQHYVYMSNRPRPQRIDFRHGGPNPVVKEFVHRYRHGSVLYGSQNTKELRKLTRVRASQARPRVLLLLDSAERPIPRRNLETSYQERNSGRGNFERHPVRVIYVHRESAYNFVWNN